MWTGACNGPIAEHADDSLARVSIAERVGDFRHAVISRAISQELERCRNNDSPVRADNPGAACLNRLGSFREVAKDEDWFPESWRFLLEAARIREDQR